MARVFVIDDDPELREFIELALRTRGHEVTLLERAPASVEPGRYDVAFIDLVTEHPESPVEAVRLLVKLGVPVAVISGLESDAGPVTDALRAGAALFLKKPFTLEELRETCGRLAGGGVLNGRTGRRESPE